MLVGYTSTLKVRDVFRLRVYRRVMYLILLLLCDCVSGGCFVRMETQREPQVSSANLIVIGRS